MPILIQFMLAAHCAQVFLLFTHIHNPYLSPTQELILFSRADLERSIPNVMDGLKPGQRKIMFSCFKKKLYKEEVKVRGCRLGDPPRHAG